MKVMDNEIAQAFKVLTELDHIRSIASGTRTKSERADLVRRVEKLACQSKQIGKRMRAGAGADGRRSRKSVFGGRP